MLTIFPLEKLLETFTKKHKTPIRKLQRSPKIIGYERECCDGLDEPLLAHYEEDNFDCDHQGKKITNNNNKGVAIINNNTNVRVKVMLTKEEATKLLAKCKEEGTLDFKDVVMELGKLPAQRIDVSVTKLTTTESRDLELATIAEEEEGEEEDTN